MGAVTNEYKYCLRGKYGTIAYTLYSEVNDHFKKQPRTMSYKSYEAPPRDVDFLMRFINNDVQKPYLDELVDKIRSTTAIRDDQVRIAVSLVQHIDYDFDGVNNDTLTDKYPYEVLYTQCGVCEEKSRLLSYLIRGLGYGTVVFRFTTDNHATVGIKCPREYSYLATGYCFVESNRPEIMTNSDNEYVVNGKLASKPRTLLVANGFSLDSIIEEYNDAKEYNKLVSKGKIDDKVVLSIFDYNKLNSINKKYGIKMDGNNKAIDPNRAKPKPASTTQPDKVIQINVSELSRNASVNVNNVMSTAALILNDAANNFGKYLRGIKKH